MKYVYLMIVVVSLLVLSTVGVSAGPYLQGGDSPTPAPPTASATVTSNVPYVPTIVPIDEHSFDCSEGTPVGWGTLTPNPAWGMLCGQCAPIDDLSYTRTPVPATVTPYAYYCGGDDTVSTPTGPDCLPVYGSTATSTPVGVGSPTPTLDPTEGIFLWGGCNTSDVSCTEVSPNYWHITKINGNRDGEANWNQQFGFSVSSTHDVYMLFHSLETDYSVTNAGLADSPPYISKVGFVETGGAYQSISWLSPAEYQSGNTELNTAIYAGTGVEKWTAVHLTVSAGVTSHLVGFQDSLNFTGVSTIHRTGQEFWVYLLPLDEPVTPTPVVTPSGYCSVVNGTGTELESDAISWTGVDIIPGSCFDIGPWEPPFPSLSDFGGAPWIAHLCTAEVDLGVATAFGVRISLLAIAYITAIAWALRNLFVS